jgi:hypothetical protein
MENIGHRKDRLAGVILATNQPTSFLLSSPVDVGKHNPPMIWPENQFLD